MKSETMTKRDIQLAIYAANLSQSDIAELMDELKHKELTLKESQMIQVKVGENVKVIYGKKYYQVDVEKVFDKTIRVSINGLRRDLSKTSIVRW